MAEEGTPQLAGGNGHIRLDQVKDRLVLDKLGTTVFFAGLDDKGVVAAKIAKPGKDALTASDADLIFNSSQNVFKIVASGATTDPSVSAGFVSGQYTTGSASRTIPHNLGYVPAILAFVFANGRYSLMPYVTNTGAGNAAVWSTTSVEADSKNVYVRTDLLCFNQSLSTGNILTIKYFLLQESAN